MTVVVALALALFPIAGPGALSAQAQGLRIAVIAGEDAINIIQQKTAVAPIVEVRDRNNLPVAGIPVTFTIGGSSATFAGLQTATVSTNAAGQAAAPAIDPVAPGKFQIKINASSGGETATTTITQTNVINAAAAGAAAAAARAGSGQGGGDGMSGAAVAAIVLGGGAAAYFVAREAGLLGGGTAACTYAVSPASTTVSSAGGNVTITLTIPGEKACEAEEWTASSSAAFITFNGNSTTSGVGATTTTVRVEPNPAGNASRTGTLTVAGQTITVTQPARCAFAVAPATLNFPLTGGIATVTVTASPAGCEFAAWTASTTATGITLTPASGTGNGTVTVTVDRSATQSPRNGTLLIAGITVPFVQGTFGVTGCVSQRVQGADVPEARTIQLGSPSGRITFRYDNGATTPDRMVVIYEGRPLFDSGCAGTAGMRTVPLSYAGRSTTVTVQVMPNCGGGSGSTWFFELACPQ